MVFTIRREERRLKGGEREKGEWELNCILGLVG